mgnify:CR=1 FL=1|tara:strand:+ start:6161 stop:6601 length:441 start_codon:yes stop_codon:yes gene_type:complete
MSLHEEIIKLRPHLTGIRFHQSFIILDFVIPVHWQVPTKGVPASVQIKVNDNTETTNSISLFSTFDNENTKAIFKFSNKLVKENMELEEKKKLLEQKIAELEVIFKGNGLESLKGLNFDIQTNEPFIPTTEVIDEDRTREGTEPSA